MAINAPMPPVFEVATRFNDAVVGREAQAAAQMAKIYVGLHDELQTGIGTLLGRLSDNPTKGEITRLWRALGLEGQVLSGLGTFGDDAASIITQGQARSIQTAMRDARRLVDVGLPPGIDVSVLEAAGVGWNQLPESSLINMLGRLGDGSPLSGLLAELGPTANRQVRTALVEGVGLGLSPREVARRTRNAFGGGLTRALRVSRTEILRSYREGNRLQWQANPRIVRQWERRAAWDQRTCPACMALDGTRYNTEDPGDFHVSDRCAMVPIPISYRELGLDVDDPSMERPTARDWFGGQPSGMQRDILGPTKYDAWRGGKIGWADMVQHTAHPDWGRSATVATLGQMGLGK
jgi:SPP1 gp7 family putative phage head morphogenesis protein